MITTAVLSCLQLAALIYLGAAAIRINRLQSLSKNLDWVVENGDFVKKYGEPVYWPLIATAAVLFGAMLVTLPAGSPADLLNVKYIGMGAGMFILLGAYYLIDKKVADRIPLRKERTATLSRRTLISYVRPFWKNTAILGPVVAFAAAMLALALQKITLATFLYDLLVLCVGTPAVWIGIYLNLREQIPHASDISRITNIDVGENYRRFSLYLQIGILLFLCIFTLLLVALQICGYDLANDPTRSFIAKMLGETLPPYHPIFSIQQWDGIMSILSGILFIWMVRCRPFRNILSIRIKSV